MPSDQLGERSYHTGYEEDLELHVEEMDLEAVGDKLEEFNREFQEEYVDADETWHAPEYWWSQRVSKLSTLIDHRVHRDRVEQAFGVQDEIDEIEQRIENIREECEEYEEREATRMFMALSAGIAIGLAVGVFVL